MGGSYDKRLLCSVIANNEEYIEIQLAGNVVKRFREFRQFVTLWLSGYSGMKG